MNTYYNAFLTIIADTRNSETLYTYLANVVKPPYDYSDLLRWQWAQAVSALDKLIHDVVRVGMVQIYSGQRNSTRKFATFSIDMECYEEIRSNNLLASNIFERQVTLKLGFLSFQDPDKIADALSYIWDESHKWKVISSELGLTEQFVKTKLKNISIRRNQIVHEGDYSNILLQRQPIEYNDVMDVINFIELIGKTIYELIKYPCA